MHIFDQLPLSTELYWQKSLNQMKGFCFNNKQWSINNDPMNWLFYSIWSVFPFYVPTNINMPETKVTKKWGWCEKKLLIMKVFTFSVLRGLGATAGPSAGPSWQLLFVLQWLPVSGDDHDRVTSNDWNARGSGKGGAVAAGREGLCSTAQTNEQISAQITTPRKLLQAVHVTEASFPKQMTHQKELGSLLAELKKGLLGMTQHWKHHYRWSVDTAYITGLIVEQSVKMTCINITMWKYRGAFFKCSFGVGLCAPSSSQSPKGRRYKGSCSSWLACLQPQQLDS